MCSGMSLRGNRSNPDIYRDCRATLAETRWQRLDWIGIKQQKTLLERPLQKIIVRSFYFNPSFTSSSTKLKNSRIFSSALAALPVAVYFFVKSSSSICLTFSPIFFT